MYPAIVLFALIWEATFHRLKPARSFHDFISQARSAPSILLPSAAAGMTLLFAVQLETIAFMTHHQLLPHCWHQLPIPLLADLNGETGGATQIAPGAFLGLIAAAQSGLLFLMYRMRETKVRPRSRIVILSACALAWAGALLTPLLTSSDAYLYIAYARLGFASFSSQPQVALHEFIPIIANACRPHIVPSAYGPAFIAYIHLLPPASPIAQILMMRAANALWLLTFLALLRAAGVPPSIVSLAAFNPALLLQYVTDIHNDLIPAVLVAAGAVLATRSLIAASAAVVTASLFKLPFMLIGTLIFARVPTLTARMSATVASLCASLLLSYVFAGSSYFTNLSSFNAQLASHANYLQYPASAVALGAYVYALARQGFSRASIYAFPALPFQVIFPWYAIWAFPYALAADIRKRAMPFLASFLILMPIMTFFMETYIAEIVQAASLMAAAAFMIISILLEMRLGKSRS